MSVATKTFAKLVWHRLRGKSTAAYAASDRVTWESPGGEWRIACTRRAWGQDVPLRERFRVLRHFRGGRYDLVYKCGSFEQAEAYVERWIRAGLLAQTHSPEAGK